MIAADAEGVRARGALVRRKVLGGLDDRRAAEHVDEPQAVDLQLAHEEVVARWIVPERLSPTQGPSDQRVSSRSGASLSGVRAADRHTGWRAKSAALALASSLASVTLTTAPLSTRRAHGGFSGLPPTAKVTHVVKAGGPNGRAGRK